MFAAQRLPYQDTNAFTKIVIDYLQGREELKPFYSQPPSIDGVKEIISRKRGQPVNRDVLVRVLTDQYKNVATPPAVQSNIQSLLSDNTFTVTTAHQPNLFTGPLYFIYKILHAIKLAGWLKSECPDIHFVPVYYMGSEDADFAELNHTYVNGKKIVWQQQPLQHGAVGRMKVDQSLIHLIRELEGQLGGDESGAELITLLRKSYTNGRTIQEATFELVNELFGAFGLVVLIPDHSMLKAQTATIFEDDLFTNTPAGIVRRTSGRLEEKYGAQAFVRDINLFYLDDGVRERIERNDGGFSVVNTSTTFSEGQLRQELTRHPEKFSPNVILRGLYQCSILPDVAFVGGGGELAYWLQLKDLFDHYHVIFPVLVLRNSFLVIDDRRKQLFQKLRLSAAQLFLSEDNLLNRLVTERSPHEISLNGNFEKATELYEQIMLQAGAIDPTLGRHVEALKTRSLKTLKELEKKMLRAEKRKFSDQGEQLHKLKSALFPNNSLQERIENFSGFYARWGRMFINELYRHSLALEQEFVVMEEEGRG